MKKLKLLLVLLLTVMIVPFSVFAEGEEEQTGATGEEVTTTAEETDKRAIVYFFRGEGCSHCAEAQEWFNSIQEELGEYFKIVDYETWYNTDNAELMTKVAEARHDEAGGVPYIIIGDKSWIGFADDYKDEIKAQIKDLYAQDVSQRYDILKLVGGKTSTKDKEEEKSGSDVLALIVIIIVCGGIGFGIYTARKNTN